MNSINQKTDDIPEECVKVFLVTNHERDVSDGLGHWLKSRDGGGVGELFECVSVVKILVRGVEQ